MSTSQWNKLVAKSAKENYEARRVNNLNNYEFASKKSVFSTVSSARFPLIFSVIFRIAAFPGDLFLIGFVLRFPCKAHSLPL